MDKNIDIIAIGECLLELSTNEYFENTNNFSLSFGGDVINTAVAYSKAGARVSLLSTIGNDYFKQYLLNQLDNYKIDVSHLRVCDGKTGLYLSSHTDRGEFVAYRNRIPNSCLSMNDYDEEFILSSSAIYATGITQALSLQTVELVKNSFVFAKDNDILTAYDPNYSSSFMSTYDTKEYIEDIIQYVDVLFLSLRNDAEPLLGLSSVEKIINYFTDYGVKIIVIKSHFDNGYYVHSNGNTDFCKFYNEQPDMHTKGTGDVFNGGFIATLIKGYTPIEAVQIAAKQAGEYINNGYIESIPSIEELLRLV